MTKEHRTETMNQDTAQYNKTNLVNTGVSGLDDILRGGLAPNRLYLVEGDPGAGKTTLALQFLLAGVARGERCMFVALSESREELLASAHSHGWTLDGIELIEVSATEESLKPDSRYTMFHPSEVELAETTKAVLAAASDLKPTRLVFDSLSELRLLAENSLRYRRQVLALKQYFSKQRCTVMFLDDRTGGARDMQVHSLAHGVISLERETAEYGSIRRRLQVRKLRGKPFREGYHDFRIRNGGLDIYPRLVAAEHRTRHQQHLIKSGLQALDDLLCGGLAKGTSTLIAGAAGTGKSSVASQYALSSALRGEKAAMFLFDESVATFMERAESLHMNLEPLMKDGLLCVQQVDPAELTPGEFVQIVRSAVDDNETKLVVIDSLNGYLNAMPSERFLMLHLHELLSFLGQRGVTTLLLMAQHGIVGGNMEAPVDASYIADTVLLIRYFEAFGEVRKAISVIKKRTGNHERTIRELHMEGKIGVGEVIRDFMGVLTGTPQFVANRPQHGQNRLA
jgi:circadian clock protein KaiC